LGKFTQNIGGRVSRAAAQWRIFIIEKKYSHKWIYTHITTNQGFYQRSYSATFFSTILASNHSLTLNPQLALTQG